MLQHLAMVPFSDSWRESALSQIGVPLSSFVRTIVSNNIIAPSRSMRLNGPPGKTHEVTRQRRATIATDCGAVKEETVYGHLYLREDGA